MTVAGLRSLKALARRASYEINAPKASGQLRSSVAFDGALKHVELMTERKDLDL
jgi:hypothetical protein